LNAPYVIEVLAHHEVRQRFFADALPIRIGRGYDNDVILDDPHSAIHHAVVEQAENGSLQLRDLGSRNGSVHLGKRQQVIELNGNTVVRLGHTRLRVRSADFPLPDEVVDTTLHNWEGWPPALAGLATIASLTTFSTWLGDTAKFETIRYLMAVCYVLAGGMVWSGIWAFANRLFGGRARFGRHFFIAGCGMAAMEAWSIFSNTAGYALSLELLTRYGSHVMIAIIAATVFYHLSAINPQRPRRAAVFAVVLSLLGSGLMLMMNYQRYGQLSDELYMAELLPPAVKLASDQSVDHFLGDAARLKDKVDAERSKTVSHDDSDGEGGE
jgi:hypothetical protein